MSGIKLFRIAGLMALELDGRALDLERPLQALIEANLAPLLDMRFVAGEYSTGRLERSLMVDQQVEAERP